MLFKGFGSGLHHLFIPDSEVSAANLLHRLNLDLEGHNILTNVDPHSMFVFWSLLPLRNNKFGGGV